MNRTIAGIPLLYWVAALGLGAGAFVWIKKKSGSSSAAPTTGAAAKPAAYSQQQEVSDFQIFSALTSAQQGSDLNFISEVAPLFSGGSSTGTGSGTGSSTNVPAPANTGTVAPATVPASAAAASTPAASSYPGYGSGLGQLEANNPSLTNGASTPGITGYTVSYNGVPLS
jgi:hypothetical protein